MSTGLGIAVAGLLLALGLVGAAWIVVRTLTGKPVVGAEPREAPPEPQLDHVNGVDLSVLNEPEVDECHWIEEVLAKRDTETEEYQDALAKLDYYRRESKRRAAGGAPAGRVLD